MRFFFYGTLMDAAVRAVVLGSGRQLAVEPATLDGWRRSPVRGNSYPIIVPAAACSVAGLLAEGIGAAAAAKLDRFEGPEYRRQRVSVRCAAGSSTPCWTYAAADAASAGAGRWEFDEWRRRHRAAMLRRFAVSYGRFR